MGRCALKGIFIVYIAKFKCYYTRKTLISWLALVGKGGMVFVNCRTFLMTFLEVTAILIISRGAFWPL